MKTDFTGNKRILVAAVLLPSIFFLACKKEAIPQPQGRGIMVIPEGFPEMPFPEDNQFSRERWELGKKLFYDPILSVDNSISCASCHKANLAFADDRDFSPGVENRPGVRNAPSLANVGYHPYYLREGNVPTLEMHVAVPVQEENEFAHNMVLIAELLSADAEYQKMATEAYNREVDPFVITRALATFQRSLISGNSRYDKYHFQGDKTVLSESEKRGMQLFFSERAKCGSCHGGFNFTDYSFQNNGLDTVYSDPGRMRLTGLPEDESLFKVPSLRNVEVTAPYMHNGKLQTLMDVVEHYNSGGKNHPNKSDLVKSLGLSQQEKEDLVAFLKSLTDDDFITNELFKK
ncbi:cytochrome-c peroxidase [Owenweeksia hongkongensis]|uniref:cytochrome-c peroxidase n=1 Tax=Owenweeksia hongkongensis TaxID=253245 RepID=UPI003A901D87